MGESSERIISLKWFFFEFLYTPSINCYDKGLELLSDDKGDLNEDNRHDRRVEICFGYGDPAVEKTGNERDPHRGGKMHP